MNKTTISRPFKPAHAPLPVQSTLNRGRPLTRQTSAEKVTAPDRSDVGILQRNVVPDAFWPIEAVTTRESACFNTPHFEHDFSSIPAQYNPTPQTGPSDNHTGMPDRLKSGLEQLSGYDLSALRVHYNSPHPARVNALAFTRGLDIRLGPGQERYMGHEGWHAVQQMQGRVKPTACVNGVLINDNGKLEHEADIMGIKAGKLAQRAGVSGFHARTAASGEALEDQPFVAGTGPSAHRGGPNTPLQRATPFSEVIQRTANFVAGPVSTTKNIAAGHVAGDLVNGFTPPTLNGTTTLSTAAARGAINAPTLTGQSKLDGTVEAWVQSVATNTGSFTMLLPSAGPWVTTTTKANVATLFARLGLTARAGCTTAGNTTFTINGRPTSTDFAANVRTHEELHARDHETGFNNVIAPWDAALEMAQLLGTRFQGASVADAEAALYAAMGGTPDQIATQQFNEWIRLNNALHNAGTTVATGGTATASNSAANADCTTSSMNLT